VHVGEFLLRSICYKATRNLRLNCEETYKSEKARKVAKAKQKKVHTGVAAVAARA